LDGDGEIFENKHLKSCPCFDFKSRSLSFQMPLFHQSSVT
jgi:hypothetical protein